MVVESLEVNLLKLSLQAYTGVYTPKTMKLQGLQTTTDSDFRRLWKHEQLLGFNTSYQVEVDS